MNFGNFVDMMRPYCLFWASIASSKVLCNDDFFQLVVQKKEDMKKNRGMNIVKIVDNVVDNLTRQR